MIIDVHTHLPFHEIYPSEFLCGLIDNSPGVAASSQMQSLVRRWLGDRSGQRLLMDETAAGVSKCVLLMIDGGPRFGEPKLLLPEVYSLHRQVRDQFPDRIIVFAGVDPRRNDDDFELFRQSLHEWNFGGMKLYPPMGFRPTDGRLKRYLDVCADVSVPVLTHSGPSLPGLDTECGNPRYVAELARQRPELHFVMAHGGHSLDDPKVKEAAALHNVWLDLAGFQAKLRTTDPVSAIRELARIFEPEFNERVLFGTDYPLFHLTSDTKADVDLIRSVHANSDFHNKLSLENVLWRNAHRLFKL